jgi:hypothetical protein
MVVATPELRRPYRYAGPDEVKAAVVSGLTKTQAKDVLDWLENHGCTGLGGHDRAGRFRRALRLPAGLPRGPGGGRRPPLDPHRNVTSILSAQRMRRAQ